MTLAASDLLDLFQSVGAMAVLVFARIAALLSVTPGFGEQVIPSRVKIGLAFAFSAIVWPSLPYVDIDTILPTVLISEVLTGLFFGICLRFFVHILQIAGSIAAQSTSLSQIFGGTAGVDPQPAMGRLLLIAGLALAAMMGLHVQVARYILLGYEMVPIGAVVTAEIAVDLGVDRIAKSFAFAFTLAAPFVVASLIYNLTLGFVNKAMPQLMVSFVGAPAITAGGLLLLLICSPLMLGLWVEAFGDFLLFPFGDLE